MGKKCYCKTYKLAIIIISILSLMSIFCAIKITTSIIEHDYVNIKFFGKIIENLGTEITVEGLPTNQDYFRGIYKVYNPGEVIIVDENGNDLLFSEIEPGAYISINFIGRLSKFKDMDDIYNIIKIKQSQTRENLHE